MNTLLIRALNKLNVLERLNLDGAVVLNGKQFKVPLLGRIGLGNLLMNEPWMIEVLKIVLKVEDKTFFDVGVNVGQTLLKLRSVSSETRYIGFEPNPGCNNYVKRLIKENALGNVELIPVGVSVHNEVGKLVFYNDNLADTYASILDEPRPNKKVNRKEFIPLFNIETVKSNVAFDSMSVLKIDVEGAELEVLQSFQEEVKQFKPIILMEILPVYNLENKSRMERQLKIQQILKESDYTIHRVEKHNSKLKDIKEIQEIGIHSDLESCDYVIVPDSKREAFRKSYQQWLSQSL